MSIFVLLLLLLLYSVLQLTASYSSSSIAKPGCQAQCGNVPIPYPFGIGPNCYHDGFYEITCNTSFQPPKPFLHKFNLEVMDIFWPDRNPRLYFDGVESEQVLVVGTAAVQHMCRSNVSIDFGGSPYGFSTWYNVLVMEGCGSSVVLKNRSGNVLTGCATICGNNKDTAIMKNFYGFGRCQALLADVHSLVFDGID